MSTDKIDGVSVTVCINDGDTHNSPTEQLEAKYPVLVEKYEIRKDSGGAGKYRGGVPALQPELIVGHGVLGRLLARIALAVGAVKLTSVVWRRELRRYAGAMG